jgi:hypothetical protein
MATRLNAVAPRSSVADRRRRPLAVHGRSGRLLSRHGRGLCMRLRRRAGLGRARSRFRYPLSRVLARVAFEHPLVDR